MTPNAAQIHPGRLAVGEFPAPKEIDRIARALADETRRQLLKFLVVTGGTLSGSRAGRALTLETKVLNRQFIVLENAQLVALAHVRPVRGVFEHLFMASPAALEDPIVKAVLNATELWPALASVT